MKRAPSSLVIKISFRSYRKISTTAMSFFCNFTDNSDCSTLFEPVHVSFTVIHAILATAIILISLPINFLIIAAMIVYRKTLDKSIILAISVLISNTIAAITLTGEIAITSISRSWLFGYWGCQSITFVATCVLFARWATVGLISLDRFCRVFWTFKYMRHEMKVIISLLLLSWSISVAITITLFFCKAFTFYIIAPGCFFVEYTPEMTLANSIVINTLLWFIRVIALFLPIILYTIMYIKARQIRKQNPVITTADNSNAESARATQRRANRATITYFLMLNAFAIVNVMVIMNDVLGKIFRDNNVSIGVAIPVGFLITIIIQAYTLGDQAIILANSQNRKAVLNLLAKITKKSSM